MKVHHSITLDRVESLARESMFGLGNPGICVSCGDDTDGVEPDAREYHCDACGMMQVYGAQELLIMLA